MAIAPDSAAVSALVNPGTSVTWAHTCSGANRILFVGAFGNTGGAGNIAGATYNGVAMTLIDSQAPVSGERWIYLWYLINPAAGANNIVVSSDGSSIALAGLSESFTGAAQTGQPDAHAKNSASAGSLTVSVTTVAANCWAVAYYKASAMISAGTGTTGRQNAIDQLIGDNNGAVAAGTTVNMSATASASTFGGIIASIAPVAAAAVAGSFMPFMSGG
jgi:hypothetical protein